MEVILVQKINRRIVSIIVDKSWTGLTVQELLRNVWLAPKKLVHRLRMERSLMVNGNVIDWNTPLQQNDIIEISLQKDDITNKISTSLPIEILFEDDHILVVNKPAGMQTHPNSENEKNTLVDAVAFYLQGKSAQPVHRLDQYTSGAVLFSKHELSHGVFNQMLEKRKIGRMYWALVDGLLQRDGVINQPIGRDRHHPTRRRVSKTGQSALTHYRVLDQYKQKKLSLIECTLETGRTHQIRVHLSYIGHPIAGDVLYHGSSIFPRQALHSRELSFIHPFSLNNIHITAPFNDKIPIFESLLS